MMEQQPCLQIGDRVHLTRWYGIFPPGASGTIRDRLLSADSMYDVLLDNSTEPHLIDRSSLAADPPNERWTNA